MKQLVILSGKGGTGKTSVAASFAHLASAGPAPLRTVLADADVDAANLGLLLQPRVAQEHDFVGGSLAVIDAALCSGCGICAEVCRFDAIIVPSTGTTDAYQVDPIACDGCAACVYQCPEKAIGMEPQTVGCWFRSETRYGPLFHAALRPAQENSGKLVTEVRKAARLLALVDGAHVILDGPPGIGCPVISAATGSDLALIVAEPSAAGVHDMERALQTVSHFRIPAMVCINKADIHPDGASQIEEYCRAHDVEVIGHIPFDSAVAQAIVHGQPVTAYAPDAPASQAIIGIWQAVVARLQVAF